MCDQTGMNEDKVRELENRLAELESRLSEQVGIIKDQAQTILEQEQTIARLKGSMGKYSESPDLLELMIKSIDNCPDIILWVNNKRDFVYVNDSACEHLGYSREELLSMNINDIDPVMKDLKTIRSMRPKEDSMDRFTAVFEKKDKTTIPVDIVGIRPLIKELTYGIMFARDMTAQVKNDKMLLEINENLKEKNEELSQLYEEVAASEEELKANNEQLVKSQEELREKNSYLELVIKASSEGIWYRNLKTHYSVMSSPWLEAAGIDIRWDSRQAGGNWQQVIHPEDLEEAREAFTSLLNGITDKYESIYRIVTANNQIKWIRTRGISIRDDKGDPYILAGVHTDITELKDQQEQLERHAYYDALTGLPNRTLFTERLLQCFRLSRRNNTRVAILFVDIDDFKKVNDTIGHGFGDELLKETASRMQAQIREYDTIARFGGDEFIIIVQDVTDNTEIIEFASRLRHCFAEPFFYGNTTFHLGCSIGAAVYPKDGTTAEELLKNSDTAMYYAKADGKDKIKFFDQKMVSDSLGKIELENDLRAAALKMDFGIHMQPSFNMKDKSLRGVELLLRWTNIRLGNIPPDFFIPIAETTGLIIPIGKWVLEQACSIVARWKKQYHFNGIISVNISAVQLKDKGFVKTVEKCIEAAGIDPSCLELEITESVFISSMHSAIAKLSALRKIGVRVALDDFGKGYSSLSYLKNLPINTLKIDKTFTDEIDFGSDRNMVSSIIALVHNLEIETIAEGVETQGQYEYLLEAGCDYVQGYLTGRPEPEEVICRLMEG